MMKCPECQAENPDTFSFCGECGVKLARICPNCSASNPAQYRFCGECGHDLVVSPESISEDLSFAEKLESIQRCLPEGLSAKVLSQREGIEGQRNQVTVMLCEMEGYYPIYARLGRDKLYPIMDEVFDILIHDVHDHGGTVNSITSSGIMALFGAPLAVEDAPQRAIQSALAIHRDMAQLSPKIRGENGIRPTKIRTGIHTGPIMVNNLADDLRVEFTPVGDTMDLASSVEKLAEPGTTCVTEETFKLTERFFDFDELDERQIEEGETPVKAYRVIAPDTRRRRADLAAERALKPFVGHEKELERLLDAEEYKVLCSEDVSLKALDRKPSAYKGRRVKYRGDITRIMEDRGTTYIIMDVAKDEHDRDGSIFIWYDGTPEALERDTIQIWGEVRGSYIYKSVAGWKTTLPLVRAEYVDVIQSAKRDN
jgi:class 3 adenylate cyclase